jgi:hypothetical protein
VGTLTVLSGEIEAHGIAAFAAGTDRVEERLAPLLGDGRAAPLTVRPPGPATEPTVPVLSPDLGKDERPPRRAMYQFEACTRDMTLRYRLRECGLDGPAPLADAVFPALHQVVSDTRHVTLSPYAIDVRPVTNAEFRRFLTHSGYRPQCADNFLRHWPTPAAPSGAQSRLPVVFVDIDDARAFGHWAQRRLPTQYEWQHAMGSGRIGYGGARVWEWTESETSDGHTRSSVLKGGADYQTCGSDWYADSGPFPPDWCAKFIRLGPALDRCATIGFRCVMDLPSTSTTRQDERPGTGAREALTR